MPLAISCAVLSSALCSQKQGLAYQVQSRRQSVKPGAQSALHHCCQCEDAHRKNVCVMKGKAGQAVAAYQLHVPGS